MHNDVHVLGGVQFQVAVLQKTTVTCASSDGGNAVTGKLSGLTGKEDKRFPIEVVGINSDGRLGTVHVYAYVSAQGGTFTVPLNALKPRPTRAVCLYAGSTQTTSAGSAVFTL